MHSLHLRLPKNFVLEERLERYASAIEAFPNSYQGRWLEACTPLETPQFNELRLDLGCGKGRFLVESAMREPHTLFIGVDNEPICIAYAAQAICENNVSNALVIPGDAAQLNSIFSRGELSRIYLNFPTPHPKRRHAKYRLVHAMQLIELRALLSDQADIIFKTDSQPLFLYAQTQLPLAGYEIIWQSCDVRADFPQDAQSGYEAKLTAQGAKVFGFCIKPTLDPYTHVDLLTAENNIAQSLVEYLPEDLTALSYIPHGMQATVANLANLQAKGKPRPKTTSHAT